MGCSFTAGWCLTCSVVQRRDEKRSEDETTKEKTNLTDITIKVEEFRRKKTEMEYSTIYTIETVFDGFAADRTVRHRKILGRQD